MGSRISFAQERQLIQRWSSGVATWSRIPTDARLVDADPAITGGLYDLTEDLYTHFRTPRILFVGSAKISKSLHLMRPHLIPVLDSKLMRLYKQPAQAAATRLAQLRPERFAGRRRCYWAAVRQDLLLNADCLTTIRAKAEEHDDLGPTFARLSDVRLLDIIAWSL